MAQLKNTTVNGSLTVTGGVTISNGVTSEKYAASWLNGLTKFASYTVSDAENTSSFYPWIRQTNTATSNAFSLGTINKELYIINTSTSRTENGYDKAFFLDSGNSMAGVINYDFKIVGGNYGFILRNDGNGSYLLISNGNTAGASFNSLRPISISNSTGRCTFGHEVQTNGRLYANGAINTYGINLDNNGSYIYGQSDSGNILFRFRSSASANYDYTNVSDLFHKKLGAVNANGFYGMAAPNFDATVYVRTTSPGLIPYNSGSYYTTCYSSLGTDTWYFNSGYIKNLNTHALSTTGNINLVATTTTMSGSTQVIENRARTIYTRWNDNANHDVLNIADDLKTTSFNWAKGTLNLRGTSIKCNGSTSWSSDKNLKHSIADINDKYEKFFSLLKPVSYQYDLGESQRYHIGYIAQDVEEALNESNLATKDFAGIVKIDIKSREQETSEDGSTMKDVEGSEVNYLLDKGMKQQYNLAYTEFIALNTHMIQKLMKKIDLLEKQIQELSQ